MPATTEAKLTDLFDQSVQTFGEALRAGIKTQEQIAGWWTDALSRASSASEYQKKSYSFFADALPAAQRNAQEWLRLLEQNYRRSVDLMKRAVDAGNSNAAGDFQARAQSLWEDSLRIVKENAEAMSQVNLKMMEMWTDVLRRNGNNVAAAASEARETVREAVRPGKQPA